jgi:photosystem II stability/assembly factor-like uncharacterized protein
MFYLQNLGFYQIFEIYFLSTMRTCFRLSILLLVLLSSSSQIVFGQTLWNWSNPKPQGNDLLGVAIRQDSLSIIVGSWGTEVRRVAGSLQSPLFPTTRNLAAVTQYVDTVWAVGDSSTILRSTDDGLNWTNESPNTYWINLHGMTSSMKTHVIVVGDSGYIYNTTNSGGTWTRETNANHHKLNAVKLDSSHAWAVGNNATLLIAANYGILGWTTVTTGDDYNYNGVAFDTNDVFIAGDSGYVFHFDPHADTVVTDAAIGSSNFYDIFYSVPNVVAVGAAGSVYISSNKGASWTSVNTGVTLDIRRVDSVSDHPGYLYAVGTGGLIMKSTNYGASWIRLDSGSRAIVYALGLSPNGNYYGPSNAGAMYSSSNSGLSWRRDTIVATFNQLPDIQFQPNGFGVLAPNGAGVMITVDSGRTWQTKSISGAQILGVGATWDSIGLAVGAGGAIYRSINKGTTWTAVTSGTHNALYDVDCWASNAVAVGYNGTFLYSTNSGLTWSSGTASSSAQFNRVRMATSTLGVAVGVVGNIYRTTDAGKTWSSVSSGVSVTLRDIAWHDNVNGMAVGDAGLILKTSNGGTSWTTDLSRTTWNLYGALITSGVNAFVAGDNGTILSTSNSLLPVELVSLQGARIASNVAEIQWIVAAQQENAEFRLDRLGSDWQTVGTVNANSSTSSFSFVDHSAPLASSIYRLRQIDLDGAEHVLGQVEIAPWSEQLVTSAVSIWPNPSNGKAYLDYALNQVEDVSVSVYDVLGHEILTKSYSMQSAGQHSLPLTTANLPAGIYHARVNRGGDFSVVTLAIVK